MAEYTKQQLMIALRNADKAGDTEGARRIAQMIGSAQQPQEPSFAESVADIFTGESRETRATRDLPELFESEGLLSTGDLSTAAKVTPALMTATDPQEMADILTENYPEIGIQYDEKGNIIAGNNETGQRVVLNKPGVSKTDVINALGLGLLAIPAGASGLGGAARAGQVAAQTGAITGAVEAGQEAVGGQFDLENVIMDMVASGALEAVPAVTKAFKDKYGQAAEAAQKEASAAEAARIGDQLSPEQQQIQQTELARETVTQARRSRPDVRDVATEVQPDPQITGAAERLGVSEKLTPGQVSGSQTYRELEGAISAIPATQLSAQRKDAISSVAQKADDLIEEFGGAKDKSALSESIKIDMENTIKALGDDAENVYSEINNLIPRRVTVDTKPIYDAIKAEADDLGGEEFLEPIQRKILKIAEGNPTYALVDKERKKVGSALNKAQGPYKDMDSGTLKMLYGQLTGAQESVAKEQGASELWDTAKNLVIQRKELEDNTIALMGKDLAGAIMPRLGASMKKLSSGDYRDFDRIIKALPKDQRETAVLSALNDVFTAGSRKEKQLSPAGFVDWYEGMKRNKSAFNRIKFNMPEEAANRLDDLYQVSRGLRNAESERVRTGVIQGLLDDFDKADGMVSKLYGVGTKLATSKLGPVSAIADVVTKGDRTPIMTAADELISSPAFKKAINSYADKSVKAKAKQEAAEAALRKSESFNKWYNLMPDEARRAIIRAGLIPWLSRGGED